MIKASPGSVTEKGITHKRKNRGKKRKAESVPPPPSKKSECDQNWKKLKAELKTKAPPHKKRPSMKKQQLKAAKPEMKAEIWFDDVPEEEILLAEGISQNSSETLVGVDKGLVKKNAYEGITKAVGIDCEMVGTGKRGSRSALARVSIVNQYGKRIYDKHVKVDEEITDYRTWVSGIRPSDLKGAEEFSVVQREVAEILKDRILVGHAVHHDLKALYLNHPKRLIRDTSSYSPFIALNNGKTPSLKLLSSKLLGVQVQSGEHSSVQDAQATMKVYMMHKKQWEKSLKGGKMQKVAS